MTYSDIPRVFLGEYIKWKKFRTILAKYRDIPFGAKEIPVIIEFKRNTGKDRKYIAECFMDEKVIYGYAALDGKLVDVLSEQGLENHDVEILLNEWDNNSFLMIFRHSDGKEEPMYFVDAQEVEYLLKNCLNPNM